MQKAKKRMKEFPMHLTNYDVVDLKLFFEGNEVVKFSLNYRAFVGNKWRSVYRIDSYHGYVHEQKFWQSGKPIALPRFTHIAAGDEIKWHLQHIRKDFKHYRSLLEAV